MEAVGPSAALPAYMYESADRDKCNDELNMAMKYEGEESVYYAFELLGEIAMTELMEDQGVSAASELFIDYIDVSIFENIFNY